MELTAVRGLSALLPRGTVPGLRTLAAALLLAGAQLRRQTQILRLLLRADANVDHRADHGWQRRSIRQHGQDAFPRHDFLLGNRETLGTSRPRCTPSSRRVGRSGNRRSVSEMPSGSDRFASLRSGFAAAQNLRPGTSSAVMTPSFFSSRTSSLTCLGNHHSGLTAARRSYQRSGRRESRLRIQSPRGRRSGSGLIRSC